ncbi:MAG: hypothetical protein JXM70_07510 [Pirellulales bacterium]|nr:hypothetical protein [Pirellulales bacterium]
MNESKTDTQLERFGALSQQKKFFWIVVFSACFAFTAINFGCKRDDTRHDKRANGSPSSQDAANDDGKSQQQNHTAQQKKEFIRWLKEHRVLDFRFLTSYPENVKQTEWNENCEKNIYNLRMACLWDGNIRDEDLRYLSKCEELSIIAFNADTTKLSAKGLRHLRGLKKLRNAFFYGRHPVPADWVKSLASLDRIEVWDFRAPATEVVPVTDDVLLALVGSQSTIKELAFFSTVPSTVKGYRAIGSITGLKSLTIACLKPKASKVGVKLSDKDLQSIALCQNLRDLSISPLQGGGVDLSVQAAKALASMPKLQDLHLDCSSSPSEEALATLGQRSWEIIAIDWPTLRAKAKRENKSVYDMSRKLIVEAASRASHGSAIAHPKPRTK